jgi:hypothetical protein
MKRISLLTCLWLLLPALASAWNDKGHMVIARLAWKELTAAERTKAIRILGKHPHYQEFLAAKRPDSIPLDEWVFMRAATWPDWVRRGPADRRRYHMDTAHYIDYPILLPGSTATPEPIPNRNAVNQIAASQRFVKNGNQEEQAVHLCWILHLIGDIHQPLHCCSFYSNDFPKGDRGGNLSKVRIEGRSIIKLHPFWDDLLGSATTLTSIGSTTNEIEGMLTRRPEVIADDLVKHITPDSWSQEGLEIAKKQIYLDGELQPANDQNNPKPEDVPLVSEDYAKSAGRTARFCAGKAGKRLAMTLRELLAEK